MGAYDQFCRFFLRFRYPVSLPEDVAQALGLQISNFVTFNQFVHYLSEPTCRPTRLHKFMPREDAEAAFQNAHTKECFVRSSLFSFYFPEGWIEFTLEFDENERLRRLYLNHKHIKFERGIEICLPR